MCCDEWFVSPCRHLCREFSLTGRTASSKTRRQCGRAEEWRSKLGGKSLHIWLIQSHSPRGKRMGILHLPVDVISICILFACNIEQSLLGIGGFKALSARLYVGHIHCCSSQIFQSPSIDSPFSIVSKEHPSNLPCKMSEMTTSNEEVSIGSKWRMLRAFTYHLAQRPTTPEDRSSYTQSGNPSEVRISHDWSYCTVCLCKLYHSLTSTSVGCIVQCGG